ncbi:MAG: extracellular solute-binding protein, partial [Spirochaetaceae bacterium]|nr:extracellular solute-binding protein [Spirochaetaceae bacterium]
MKVHPVVKSVVLLVLALSLAVGCSSPGGGVSGGAEAPPAAVSMPDTVSTDGEPYTITALWRSFQTEPPQPDNIGLKKLEELTNTKLDITFLVSNGYDEKLNVLIASEDLPMVTDVTNQKDNVVRQAVAADAFWDITDYISNETLFPNISQHLPMVQDQVKFDGRSFSLYLKVWITRHGWLYRSDWLENVGLSEPKNLTEFREVVRAFAEDDPDGNGQDDTAGLLSCNASVFAFTNFAINYGTGNEWEEDGNGGLRPIFYNDKYFEALDYMREIYASGQMNQDFASAVKQDLYTYWQAGEGGLFYTSLDDAYTTAVKELTTANPDATYDMFSTLEGPGGETRNYTTVGWNGMAMFSKKAVETEDDLLRCLKFFDDCMTQPVQELLE